MKAIMYHYVRPGDAGLPYFRHLHVEDFEQQLHYFKAQFGFVSKDDFLQSIETGAARDGVVLTFDDGFKDHYEQVLPRLSALGLWGIFYIPTGVYPARRLLDVHRIHLLLGKFGGRAVLEAMQTMVTKDMLSHAHIREFRTETYKRQKNDDYVNLVKRTLNYYIGYEHRSGVVEELMLRFLPAEQALAEQFYMSEPEIRSLHQAGMIVGSHSVNHPVMSKLNGTEQETEIADSFAFLEKVTGGLAIRTFCYPYGGYHTFTDETERLLMAHGCRFSFNVEEKDLDSNFLKYRLQALPRYDCNLFPFGACRMGE
jgi:peptidoglycan/xylan/chitin deacetylase (PgdA/CDA1 family)